jgi:hypothetical protein
MKEVSMSGSEYAAPVGSALPVVDLITTKADIDLCLGSGELLPCPFCGHWAMSAGEKTPNGKAVCWKISCSHSRGLIPDCCASVWATDADPAKARRDAVARWNRRPNAAGQTPAAHKETV